jgi:hypothetical protein
MRGRWRQAAIRQLGRMRLIAQVSSALTTLMVFAIGLAIWVGGLRVLAEGAAPLIVAVVFNSTWFVAFLSVWCHWTLGKVMRCWEKEAATPLYCGAIQPASEVVHRMQCESARRARSVTWIVAIVAGAAVAVAVAI